MAYGIACFVVFLLAYTLNMLYTSVFYHRGLTHGSVRLGPRTRRFVILTGSWVTGIDPKTWVCMHRRHHKFADTRKDPHSPVNVGVFRIGLVQLRSYGRTMQNILKRRRSYTSLVKDLDFPVHWLHRSGLWYLPHVVHLLIFLALGILFHSWVLGLCFLVGVTSHPLQGWMVNAFGHAYGYRNFNTRDHSTNNLVVSMLVMGEGFQNNHHHKPKSPNFSSRWWEIDLGYGLCLISRALGLVEFNSVGNHKIPTKLLRSYRVK
jgi:stearoyl-CoA desaturase (Delta-9 desaturase)